MLEKLIRKCRIGILLIGNRPAYVAEKAQEERWQEIVLEFKPFHSLSTWKLAGYSIIAGNPKHKRKYEVNVTPAYEKFKTETPEGKKIVIKDSADLRKLCRLQVFYFLRDTMIPEAQKRNVKTNIDLKMLEEYIQRIEGTLNNKYL